MGPNELDLSRDGESTVTVTTRGGDTVTVNPDSFTPNGSAVRDKERHDRRQRIDQQRTMQNLADLADQLGRHYRAEQQLVNPTTGMPTVDAIKEFFAPLLGQNPNFSRGTAYDEIDRALAFPAMEFARNVDIGRTKQQMLQRAEHSGKDVEQVEKDFDRVVANMRGGIDNGLDPRQALSDAINETGSFGSVGNLGSHSSSDNDAQGVGDLSSFGYYGFDDPRNTYGTPPSTPESEPAGADRDGPGGKAI